MGLAGARRLYLQAATRLSEILAEVVAMQPRAVVIDSIQTVYLDDVSGSAGSVSQARTLLQKGIASVCCLGYSQCFRVSIMAASLVWPVSAGHRWLSCSETLHGYRERGLAMQSM